MRSGRGRSMPPTATASILGLLAGFVDEAGEGGAHGEVVDLAEGVEADAPGSVDDDQAGGASQLVAAHGDGQGDSG